MSGIGTARQFKLAAKAGIARVLYSLGVFRLWQTVRLRRKAVVLMYHRVLTPGERRQTGSHPGIIVTAETFARHMTIVRRHFEVLSVEEFCRRIENREPLPDSSCVITFDDGWRDTFANAVPILKRHGFSAVVFLPVNYIGARRHFWREALTHLLRQVVVEVQEHPEKRRRFEELLRPSGLHPVLVMSPDAHFAAVDHARLSRSAADALVEALAAELGVNLEALPSPDTFVDWPEVDAMARDGIRFGGHGADHHRLTQVGPDVVGSEVAASKTMLDKLDRGAVPVFSYPNGDWSPAVAAAVRECGYRFAFTTEHGAVGVDDDRWALKRVNIHEEGTATEPLFLARVLGLF